MKELKEKRLKVQKFTYDNFIMLLQSLHGHQNEEIMRSIKFFSEKDFKSFIKEFKYLLESTKVKELIKFRKYLKAKVDDAEYKEGYDQLTEAIKKFNKITGMKRVYDEEKMIRERDFEVIDPTPEQFDMIKKEFLGYGLSRKRTQLELKFS